MADFYWSPPSAADLASTAYRPSDFPRPELSLWVDCLPPFELYARYQTQWRVGARGPIGLDYSVLIQDLERQGVTPAELEEMMDAIRVIEQAALAHFHKG